jgi:hypothetical protein
MVAQIVADRRTRYGLSMRRFIVVTAVGLSLAGCSSFSMGDYFKSTPPTVQVQLDSTPPGADARTSIGPGCKTPCSVTLPISPETTGFAVSYSLNKFLPATVQALITRAPGDFSNPGSITVDPNPVVAQLESAGPAPKAKRVMRPKKPKPPKAAATEPADPSFPAPAAGAAPAPPR